MAINTSVRLLRLFQTLLCVADRGGCGNWSLVKLGPLAGLDLPEKANRLYKDFFP